MKRPGLYLSLLFLSIILSTVLVSTTVSGICKAFYKEEAPESSAKVSTGAGSDVHQASVKF